MTVVIIMGVSGSGKTSVGKLLAKRLSWHFADADQYHSADNIAKMASGSPLTDVERKPWISSLRTDIVQWLATKNNTVLACSALKKSYRTQLQVDPQPVKIVYLTGTLPLFKLRLEQRQHHYMKSDMLESQLQTLEEPARAEALFIDASKPVGEQVDDIIVGLKLATTDGG